MNIDDLKNILNSESIEDPETVNIKGVHQLHHEIRDYIDKLGIETYGVDFINKRIDIPFDRYIRQQKMPWLKEKCVIGVIGSYASGKTTLLNHILDMNLPTNIQANTALPTYISQGNKSYKVLTRKNELKDLPDEMFCLFDHLRGDNFPFFEIFKYLIANKQSDLLDRVSFLDTPGISNNQYDLDVTSSVINQCNTVFWVKDSTKGDFDNQVEIPFMEKYLVNYTKNLYIITTFADRCMEIKAVFDVMGETLNNNQIKYKRILPFAIRTNHDEYLSQIINIVRDEAENSEPFHPANTISYALQEIKQNLNLRLGQTNTIRNKLEEETDDYLVNTGNTLESIYNGFNASKRALDNLQNTIQNRCSGVFLCSSTFSILKSQLDSYIDTYNTIVEEYNSFNIEKIKSYGATSIKFESAQAKYLDLSRKRDRCLELINKIRRTL